MTEDEAKAKVCPFSRDGALSCIGDECAVWRWIDTEPTPGFVLVDSPDGPITVRKPTAEHYGWAVIRDLSRDARRGFCGAGGRP